MSKRVFFDFFDLGRFLEGSGLIPSNLGLPKTGLKNDLMKTKEQGSIPEGVVSKLEGVGFKFKEELPVLTMLVSESDEFCLEIATGCTVFEDDLAYLLLNGGQVDTKLGMKSFELALA